jgi:hypothetical protein
LKACVSPSSHFFALRRFLAEHRPAGLLAELSFLANLGPPLLLFGLGNQRHLHAVAAPRGLLFGHAIGRRPVGVQLGLPLRTQHRSAFGLDQLPRASPA